MHLSRRFFRWLLDLYPRSLRKQVEAELPALTLSVHRLATEVMHAELLGKTYTEAIDDPGFPLMARVHYGVADTLRWRVPPEFVETFKEILQHAVDGDFDPMRQLLFAVATSRNDPEGALCRFLFWQAIRLNLMIATWNDPIVEAARGIYSIDEEAEDTLKAFLRLPEMLEPEVRPLNVLVAAAAVELDLHVGRLRQLFARESPALEEIFSHAKLVSVSRQVDARAAAVLWPGEPPSETSSQQVADRFPHHFPTANAVEAQRSRTVRLLRSDGVPEPSGDRYIDLIQQFAAEVE